MENQEEKKIGKVADRVRELEEIKARKEAGALFCILSKTSSICTWCSSRYDY